MNAGTDQWKKGGNCNECRKASYCKKKCSEHKRFMDRAIREIIAESKIGKMMNAIHQATGSEYADDGR